MMRLVMRGCSSPWTLRVDLRIRGGSLTVGSDLFPAARTSVDEQQEVNDVSLLPQCSSAWQHASGAGSDAIPNAGDLLIS